MKRQFAVCCLVCALVLSCASAMAAKIGEVQTVDASGVVITKQSDQKSVKVAYKGQKDKEYVIMAVSEAGIGDEGIPTKEKIGSNQEGVVVYMDQAKGDSEGNVEFTVHPNLEQAKAGDEYFLYISSNASNSGMTKIGSFDINELLAKIGDIDGVDGVNVNDAIYILKYLANIDGYDITGKEDSANVDGVGGVDVNDAIYILKYLANIDGYTLD